MKRIYGIDLGTTYSSIAYIDEYGKPVLIPNVDNQRLTPSVVFFDADSVIVGEVAKESAKLYPEQVVCFIKRSMGEANFLFEYSGKSYRPEEIASFILRKLVQDARQSIDDVISDVVITCPAYFGINEREATRAAGEIAGLNVRQIINEPTAAAIAYGEVSAREPRTVLVFDLGGGTFDITMIGIRPGAVEVICTGGDHNLGGKDWDDRIVAYMVQEFQRLTKSREDILEDPETWQDLQNSAEKCKKMLSRRDEVPIAVTYAGKRVKTALTREKFEEITRDLLERTIWITRSMLDEARKKGCSGFDEFILVGGLTRMPQVAARIRKEFDIEPKMFDPDEAIAKGAAIFGWKLSVNDDLVRRVAQKTCQDENIVKAGMDLRSETVREALKEMADEIGYELPAVEGALISIQDVASKSFGVVAHNSENQELIFNLILRNTPVPAAAMKNFYTAAPSQKTVLIRIMESETSDAEMEPKFGVQIGTVQLNLPAGLPADSRVEISFTLNREGRLTMTAFEPVGARAISFSIDTASVIQGKALAEAKVRS
ncbi:MAG: Hsp70 family protein, partial [Desulfobacterales bacterium]|nr:Hsp70 family protein [Desulfobacterales bacterium]